MRDFLIGLGFIIAGGAIIYTAQQFPTLPSLSFGPSLFPSLVGGGFCLGGLLMASSNIKIVMASSGFRQREPIEWKSLMHSLLPVVMIIFYITFSDMLGALTTIGLIMFVLMKARKTPILIAAITSIVMSSLIYFIFSKYLLIPLPQGELFNEVKQWML
ncbi:tripartite tricarboxylate transporter TctB family protein [Aidingimonas lacisalsi]|uniref:tripartite tricarboxylate transporter TctB family protein n=1 Tax=Aidingimonas lacisalsi TaxID=2604086 RepID=UPI0011D261B5|nr:tripartite tricarboxylate transporter TctB family protein [Aidingimonas lacisalsi]